jgi:hypothetical protein
VAVTLILRLSEYCPGAPVGIEFHRGGSLHRHAWLGRNLVMPVTPERGFIRAMGAFVNDATCWAVVRYHIQPAKRPRPKTRVLVGWL